MCNICETTNPDALDDSIADLFGGDTAVVNSDESAAFAKAALSRAIHDPVRQATFEEPCKKCRGSGRFMSYTGRDCGPCFTCKGKGTQTFKTSAAEREKRAAQDMARHAAKIKNWMDTHEEEMAWLTAATSRGFQFASDSLVALGKYGDLNEARLDKVHKFMAQDLAREEERVRIQEMAPTITGAPLAKIEQAFTTALDNQIKYPKLRLDTFIFSPAQTGKNAGSIYVKHTSEVDRNGDKRYLGKITDGRFVRAWGCTDDEEQRIIAAATDPEAAAKAYGQREGACSICGRKLTKNESIDRAMGPVCSTRYGW
jgi:Family of unknown function (DUF6011)